MHEYELSIPTYVVTPASVHTCSHAKLHTMEDRPGGAPTLFILQAQLEVRGHVVLCQGGTGLLCGRVRMMLMHIYLNSVYDHDDHCVLVAFGSTI